MEALFPGVSPAHIHRAVMTLGQKKFLVYGYVDGGDRNLRLAEIKPSTIWRGEIIVFQLGHRVPFLSRPNATKIQLDKLAGRFVS